MKKYFCILSLIFVSFSTIADEKHNSLGVYFGTGAMHTDYETESDDTISHIGAFYEYHLNPNLSIHTTYLDGSGELCFITCSLFEHRKFNYRSLQVSAKGSVQLTNRWYGIGRLGINNYRLEFTGTPWSSEETIPDSKYDGVRPVVALGGEFRAFNGFKFGFEAQYLPMNDIDIRSYNVFVGFSF